MCEESPERAAKAEREHVARASAPVACLPMPVCATRARACTRALVSHRRFPFRPLVVVSSRPPFSVSVSALTSPCAMCRYSYRRLVSSSPRVVFLQMPYRRFGCITIGLPAMCD